MSNLSELMFDATTGLKNIIWIQDYDVSSDDMTNLIESMSEDLFETIFGFKPEGSDNELADEICSRYCGWFIAEAHTPVVFKKKGSTGGSYSWGHTTYQTLLAQTFDELVEKAVKWSDSVPEREEE